VNKIATLRNTRTIGIPNVEELAELALSAGAHGITVHPRPDQRHIRPDDVARIAAVLRAFPSAEYNIEGNPFHGLVEHCEQVRPAQATLVPDAQDALTSNHGWNLSNLDVRERTSLMQAIARLHAIGTRVSLFVDPDAAVMPLAREVGADRIELYTEPYAAEVAAGGGPSSLALYRKAAQAAESAGLGVNAGHDLNLDNLGPFLAELGNVDEVSIGHALIADALVYGLEDTVKRYLAICA